MRVAATIPAFDAAATVSDVVARTRALLDEVVVVDDGSSDATTAAAGAAGARVLVHRHNAGKGAALRTAMGYLFKRGFDAVVTLDADGQHLPEEIPFLIEAMRQGSHLIIGCRREQFQEMCSVRRYSNRLSSWWISWLSGTSLNDTQCGFRVYTRELYEAVGLPESRYDAESAVIVRAARNGFRVAAVPVRPAFVDGRACSHFRPILDSWRIARAVLRARYQARPASMIVQTVPRS